MSEQVVWLNGQPARVVNPPRVLPQRLDALLGTLRNVVRHPLIVRGASRDCNEGEHRFGRWMTGVYGLRELLLLMCQNCETVEVRDVSFFRLPEALPGSPPLRRRDELLGWYSGARRNGREYR